jgi:predicted phage tail protein
MSAEKPIAVHLYGPLADKYGALHHFAVSTPHEAVAALDANYPGFVRDFAQHEIYHILADGDWRDGEEAAGLPVSRELHLVPQIEGRVALGALLVGALIPSLAGTFAATLIGGALFLGVMIGLSFLFRPKMPETDEGARNESYAFTGPENVVTQGAPVPLAYGKVHCGSVVVSAGLEVSELGSWVFEEGEKNELKSKQYARVIDVISDGIVSSLENYEIFLDGVAIWHFKNTYYQVRQGTRDQPIVNGFPAAQTEIAVGVEVEYGTPLVRSISNTDCDRVRFTLMVPALQHSSGEGDQYGTNVIYQFDVEQVGSGTGYQYLKRHYMSGMTASQYQRAYLFDLPKPGPWNIRVTRTSPKSTDIQVQHDLYWSSYTEIIDDRVNYNGTACVGLFLDSEQFQQIPKRTYYVTGIRMLIPNNYDATTGIYSGVWDGTFAWGWTNNPAWILYDILINRRHGIGRFLDMSQVDKWAIYRIGQWCDQYVPDGKGSYERRWVCNVQITDRQEAFDLIGQIASIFRGWSYWSGTSMVAGADQPSDPVHQFTNANVIDGVFTYAGSDLRARHTMATVLWNDPAQLGQPRLAVVEDQEGISRYGIQETEIPAIGCTSEGQAVRTGKWALYTELYEGESIAFATGLKSAFVRPGEIIRVSDVNIGGKRRGGRVVAGTTDTVIMFDASIGAITGSQGVLISCEVGEGVVETRWVYNWDASMTWVGVTEAFSAAPALDSVFVVNEVAALEPTLWRVISVSQREADAYEINGVRHYPGKWDYVENNIALSTPDISDIPVTWPAVQSLTATEYLVQLSPISIGVRVSLSWVSAAPHFIVDWRPQDGNWTTTRTDAKSIDLPVEEGPYQFRVVPVSQLGVRGPPAMLNYTVIGRYAPPAAPLQFRIKISDGVALFEWLPAVELDVIIGGHFELRHSSQTSGASWASAQVVIPSIPGNATSAEAVYRAGTWFLRTFDIVGTPSKEVATIISLQPDGRYTEFARVCEHPDWLGDHNFTEVLEPQYWLIIGQTGGEWDAQIADMDDWPDVDVLVENAPSPPYAEPRHGWYIFEDLVDAGGVFTVRFSAEILAFPYAEGDAFIDDRLNNVDEWSDWDEINEDLGGQVQLFIRTTNDDPASPSATWGAWQPFSPVEYTARGFEFRADLYAPAGQNIGIEKLCITADLRMKMDSAEDVPYPAATTHVTFAVKFYLEPSVVVTVQNALATDDIQVINKTRQGFDVTIKQGATHQTRTFDWQARGF